MRDDHERYCRLCGEWYEGWYCPCLDEDGADDRYDREREGEYDGD